MKPSIPAGVGAQLTALAGPLAPYVVELLLTTRVPLDALEVRRALGEASGELDVNLIASGGLTIAYLDHRTDFQDRKQSPMVHLLSYAEDDGDRAGREAALQQTWDWPDPAAPDGGTHAGAAAALARAGAVLTVMVFPGLQSEERLALFQHLVRALVARLPVLAIHWVPSARIVDPATYLVPEKTRPLRQGPVNVRMFKPLDAAPGTLVMDTLGLTALGLRDLQVVFRELATDMVAGWLHEVARQVFARGDFIQDRDTIDGVGGVWRGHHGEAAVGPARKVIDFRAREEAPFPVPGATPRAGVRCPECGWSPDDLSRWECECGFVWNTFDTRALCPACDTQHVDTACLRCNLSSRHRLWYT